jgi:propanol-preferring alcohol dehydrogenase
LRAVRLERFGEPLVVDGDAVVPGPEVGEVLVRVTAAGVCGTDVKLWRGDLPNTPLPLIPGHETAGVVEAAPEGAAEPGTRVVIFHHLHCGACAACRAGRENLCRELRGRVGFDHPGGWAEYVRVPARNVIPIPDGVSAAEACVVPDAVATVWRALLTVGALEAGEGVAVIGAGGLGLSACQIASEHGGDVLAVDISEAKLARASELGARLTALPDDALEASRQLSGGAARLIVDCAGTPEAVALSISLLPAGGRLVQVGYSPASRLELHASDVVLRELRILGCRASALADLRDALAAVGRGMVTPVLGQSHPLEGAQLAIDALVEGSADGRQVLVVSHEGA